MLQFITRSGNLTGVMPRLYISCHPADFELHFRTLCSDIFAVQDNCAVFYEDDPAGICDEEELFALLGEMRLVVVPVTRRLLSESSCALDVELPFAVRNNIPVLPLMAEPDESGELVDLFNSTEVFGGMQFLDRYDKDPTALRYEDKLATYLRSELVSEEDVKRINEEFSSRIFLSYRKKDRAHAQELMRRIHRVDVCRDTAIWYDEYLIPGESFDSNIKEALDESDVFVMSVTSSFEEPGNYVADHEYPDAVRKSKPLIAADMKHFDQASLEKLEGMYPGIMALMVDPDDTYMLGVTLRQRLVEDAGISESDLLSDDGEHLYYIALAYKNGIRTEADPARAAELFRLSADNGCYEAYIRLIQMHRMGDGVPKDNGAALVLCEKAISVLEPLEGSSLRTDNVLAAVYNEKGHIFAELHQTAEELEAYRAAYRLRRRMNSMYEDASAEDFCESMISVAAVLFASGSFEEARELADEFISENGLVMEDTQGSDAENTEELSMLRMRARICSMMSAIYIQLKKHSEVTSYAEMNVETCERIEELTGSAEDLRALADAYLGYANFLPLHELDKANACFEKYEEIKKRLAEYDSDRPPVFYDAADCYQMAGNALLRFAAGDASAPEKAKAIYNEALEICGGLTEGTDRYNALILTAMIRKQLGEIERVFQHSNSGAIEEYGRALDICRGMDREYRNDTQVLHIMSEILDQIGTIYLDAGGLTEATEYYTDALETDMRASRINRDPGTMHNLAKSYMRCAEINLKRGHQPIADVNNRSALKILEPLVSETDDYRIIEDLALVLLRLGMSERFKREQRLELFGRSAEVYGQLMAMTNNADEYVNSYAYVKKQIEDIS